MKALLTLILKYGNSCAAAANVPRNSPAAREAHKGTDNQLDNIRCVLDATPVVGYQIRAKSPDFGWEAWQLVTNSTAELVIGREDYQVRRLCVHPADADAQG